ncbi:MAG TPA: polyprenyl diphosphate synthase [Chloroflexota bacterium]|nr:polyprenyl diphosphate synthase [Chloroflexota bacterium]
MAAIAGGSEAERRVPHHVAIIMDGNGRWAARRGQPRLFGHRAGTNNLRRVLEAAVQAGVGIVTIYAFSTENWDRSREEVSGLLRILGEALAREAPRLHKNGVQIRHLGSLEGVPDGLAGRIRDALELTRHNDRLILQVAFNYGGRAEIVEAVRRIIREGIPAAAVDEDLISSYLYTAGLPDPDLIIRTAGEMRLSNFLLWQASYAEYYSTPTFWPDFDEAELQRALDEYASRDRRFGKRPDPSPPQPTLRSTPAIALTA